MNTENSSLMDVLPMPTILFPTTFEYRLHKIKTSERAGKAKATIYDGRKQVFQTHGRHLGEAIKRAKAWIDEQEEVTTAHDLHTA